MRFCKQIAYNAVPEWRAHYMDYGALKKLVPQRTTQAPQPLTQALKRSASSTVLDLERADVAAYGTFAPVPTDGGSFAILLHAEIDKVDSFYARMEDELVRITASLVTHVPDDDSHHGIPRTRETMSRALRKRYTEHFVEICELQTFAQLNKTGFEKVLKNFDKHAGTFVAKANLIELQSCRFWDTSCLKRIQRETEKHFARLFWDDDIPGARHELQQSLHELLVWERNTVWRDMLLSERRLHGVHTEKPGAPARLVVKLNFLVLALACSLLILARRNLLLGLIDPDAKYSDSQIAAAHRALALLALVSILWATEAVPLYVTSIAIMPLSVVSDLFLDSESGRVFPAVAAAKAAMSGLGASVIMLIIGGYTISAALSKYAIDRYFATSVLARVRGPNQILLVVMLLAAFLSMWVSNVAAPVLLNSVMLTILRGMPNDAVPLTKATLLGIAMSCNVGGMGSPIASPQNAIALSQLRGGEEIGFAQWICTACPLVLVMVLVSHALLVAWYRPDRFHVPFVHKSREKFGKTHYFIILTLAATIFLWCYKPALGVFGSEGIIAAIPVVLFFGSGILAKEDFDNLPWHVVFLVAGGICLGTAIESSDLLDIVSGALYRALRGASLWTVYAVFLSFILLVSSTVSHTVCAIIVLPIIAQVGASMGHNRLLVMGGALACSGGMCLPVSSFPNVSCVSVENEMGKRYISALEVTRVGAPMTAVAGIVLVTLGFAIMYIMGL